MLYDLRSATRMLTEADVQQVADRVRTVGEGRARGPVGLAIDVRPEWLRLGIRYSEVTRKMVVVEVLLTPAQLTTGWHENGRLHPRRE